MANGTSGSRPKLWSVLESEGSRVVREGCSLGSPELPQKLGAGSVVQELALEGDRLHYWLQSGTGPTNGWVSIKVRGKQLVVRREDDSDGWGGEPPEVWIATMGTRGDLQPFVVLGLALQEAGYRVRLFGPPELRSFTVVANGTIKYDTVCGGWAPAHLLEQISHELDGISGDEPDSKDKVSTTAEENLALGRPAYASSAKSRERGPSLAVDGKPETRWTSAYEDRQWLSVDLGDVCSLSRVEIRWEVACAAIYLIEASLDGETWKVLTEELGREGWVTSKLPAGSRGRWVRMFGQKRATNWGFSVWEFLVFGSRSPEGQPEESPEASLPEVAGETNAGADAEPESTAELPLGPAPGELIDFLSFIGVDTKNPGDVGHMVWLWREMPQAVLNLQKELEMHKPDLLLFNHLMVNVGLYAWRSYAVRSLFVNLGLEFYFAPQARDVFNYRTLSAFDSWVMRKIVGVATVSAMRKQEFNEFYTSSDRILGTTRLLKSVMPLPEKDRGLADKWNFTGFWILEENRQMEDPTAFGGPDVLQRLRNFVEAGAAPVYLGWGSMPVGARVLAMAVTALRHLRLRAVAVRGWGHFSREFLSAGILETGKFFESDSLLAYADANVLFIDKAPHEWLFPRCACTVHHGGAGTTAAALRAGVPTVIVPLGYDQSYHGEWVESLGVGVRCKTVMEIQEGELLEALRRATGDRDMADRSRVVASQLRQEPGVAGAVAQIRRVIQEDVRSGQAQRRWEQEEEVRRQSAERAARHSGRPQRG